jgi:hypothetical protein
MHDCVESFFHGFVLVPRLACAAYNASNAYTYKRTDKNTTESMERKVVIAFTLDVGSAKFFISQTRARTHTLKRTHTNTNTHTHTHTHTHT